MLLCQRSGAEVAHLPRISLKSQFAIITVTLEMRSQIHGGPEGTQPVVNIFATSYIYSRQVANILATSRIFSRLVANIFTTSREYFYDVVNNSGIGIY